MHIIGLKEIQKKSSTLFLTFSFLLIALSTAAQPSIQCDYEINSSISAITNPIFKAGDTICLMAGIRGPLYLKNLVGTAENPIVILNKGGQCIIDSDLTYGLKFADSKHVVVSGSGDNGYKYGIYIRQVTNGYGLDIGNRSSDFDVSNLEISNVKVAGIVAKTDPNCVYLADRDNFTLYNLKIHENYIHHTGDEGMYIGSSYFLGQYLSACDSVQYPHIINGLEIYNNRIEYTGWDAIQVGSALYNCNIHDNYIYKDSQAEVSYQMSGIMINIGSSCNAYNNTIIDGKGTGIINQGSGGQKFFNNLIINAGRDYYPDDQTLKQQFGIFSKYTYIHPPDSSFQFYNNTIINPKSDGIRFWNSHSKNNKFINNLIINPGAYDYYKNLGSVNFDANDAYIHNYLDSSEISSFNNIFERSSISQFFVDTLNYDYHLTVLSPAVNMGFDVSNAGVSFDIENNIRPFENIFDIGAFELQTLTPITSLPNPIEELLLIPNPAKDYLEINLSLLIEQYFDIKLFTIDGKEIKSLENIFFNQGKNIKRIPIHYLPKSEYLLVMVNASGSFAKKFLKR